MNNTINFYKYHGAGNDFVMVDNRIPAPSDFSTPDLIAHLCHRNFGIGADGFILLENDVAPRSKLVIIDGLLLSIHELNKS